MTKGRDKESGECRKSGKTKSNLIPDVKQYLIPDFINCNFENKNLDYTAKDFVSRFIETGDLKYLVSLSSIQSIYMEKVFWKQIFQWNKYASYGYSHAGTMLEAVTKGTKRTIIRYKTHKAGRPPSPPLLDTDILTEYQKLYKKLVNQTITNLDLDNIRKLKRGTKISAQARTNEIKDIRLRRKRVLQEIIQIQKLKFTQNDIDRLIAKTNANICYEILAMKFKVGTRKIKEAIASQSVYADPNEFDDGVVSQIEIKLEDGKTVTIDMGDFDRAKSELADVESTVYFEKLAEKLNAPIEAIKHLINGCGKFKTRQTRQPHIRKAARSKRKK